MATKSLPKKIGVWSLWSLQYHWLAGTVQFNRPNLYRFKSADILQTFKLSLQAFNDCSSSVWPVKASLRQKHCPARATSFDGCHTEKKKKKLFDGVLSFDATKLFDGDGRSVAARVGYRLRICIEIIRT